MQLGFQIFNYFTAKVYIMPSNRKNWCVLHEYLCYTSISLVLSWLYNDDDFVYDSVHADFVSSKWTTVAHRRPNVRDHLMIKRIKKYAKNVDYLWIDFVGSFSSSISPSKIHKMYAS